MNTLNMCAYAMLLFLIASCGGTQKQEAEMKEGETFNYPDVKKVDTVDTYFGTEVADPYRWLEDMDSEETKQWVEAQNAITKPYLNKLPANQSLKDRYKNMMNFPRQSTPFMKGKRIFYFKNNGLQNQSVLYFKETLEGEEKMLLDPNSMSEDGTISLSGLGISDDGNYLAYSISEGGSDWQTAYVMEISSRKKLEDKLDWLKFTGLSWYKDGFFYARFPEPKEGEDKLAQTNTLHSIYYHKIGEPQEKDKLVFRHPNKPEMILGSKVTEDNKYLIIYLSEGAAGNNQLMVKDLEEDSEPIFLKEQKEGKVDYIANFGETFILQTDIKAPNFKLVSANLSKPGVDNWTDLVPEQETVIDGAAYSNGKFIVTYMEDAANTVSIYSKSGEKIKNIDLPGIGTVGGFGGESDNPIKFYTFTSYNTPATTYKYNVEKDETELFWQAEVPFDPSQIKVEQRFFESKDGTKVPMFMVYHKDNNLSKASPTYLYGYGGFNISLTPSFQVSPIPFIQDGGVYAIVNLRGGGEYGKEWHEMGMKQNKQNVFDDFIAAAEYLIEEGITSTEQLAIAGGSNGGLLVGAAMTQRPDLFAVALPSVGVLDMLRFHKFTIGYAWTQEYGNPEENEEDFKTIYAYSPLHNIKEGTSYPATLVKTADHDDRVVPAHSFKFISTLQEAHEGKDPVLIRIDTKAGHGAGKPLEMIVEELADTWAFVYKHTGMSTENNTHGN